MKKQSHNKFILLTSYSFLFTVALLLFNHHVYKPVTKSLINFIESDSLNNFVQQSVNKLRALTETDSGDEVQEESIKEVCKDAGDELYDMYYTPGKAKTEKKEDEDGNEKTETTKQLIELIDGQIEAVAFVKKYIFTIVIWAVFIVFAVLSIFFWFGCCCCCCCPCCCCRQSEKNKNANCCRYVSFIISIVLFGGVIVLSVYGFFGTLNMVKGLNGSLCASFQLYWELLNGQHDTSVTPYWKGIDGITSALNEITVKVENIRSERDEVFTGATEAIDTAKTGFPSGANDYDADDVQVTSITTPPVTFDFSSFYFDGDEKRLIKNMQTELEQFATKGIDLLNKADEASKNIDETGESVEKNINDIENIITDISDKLEDIVGKNIKKIIDVRDVVVKYMKLALFIFFGVFTAFAAIILVFTILFVICKIKCFRCIIHLFWNILNLIMIFSFIIGAIIGVVGTLGQDATKLMSFLISKQNLQTDFQLITGNIAETLNTCFYGDGDISTQFSDLTSMTNDVEDLRKMQDDFEEVIRSIPESSATLQEHIKLLKNSIEDLESLEKEGDQISTILNELNSETCVNSEMKLVFNMNSCEDNNCKIPSLDKQGVHYISWENLESQCYGFESALEKIELLETCATDLKNALDSETGKLNTLHNGLSNQFNGVSNIVRERLNKLNSTIISEVINLLDSIGASDGSSLFNSLVNCRFLGNNIVILVDELHKGIGDGFYNFGVILETICSLQGIGVFFLLIVLNRYHPNFKKKKKDKEETKEPEDPQEPIDPQELQDLQPQENNETKDMKSDDVATEEPLGKFDATKN